MLKILFKNTIDDEIIDIITDIPKRCSNFMEKIRMIRRMSLQIKFISVQCNVMEITIYSYFSEHHIVNNDKNKIKYETDYTVIYKKEL